MDTEPCFTIDFDDWSKLAQHDPNGFEARRRAMLDSFIKAQPRQRRQRLRCLQWRVDRIREGAATPLLACQRISDLMWLSFAGPTGLREALTGALSVGHETPLQNWQTAKILPFRRPG